MSDQDSCCPSSPEVLRLPLTTPPINLWRFAYQPSTPRPGHKRLRWSSIAEKEPGSLVSTLSWPEEEESLEERELLQAPKKRGLSLLYLDAAEFPSLSFDEGESTKHPRLEEQQTEVWPSEELMMVAATQGLNQEEILLLSPESLQKEDEELTDLETEEEFFGDAEEVDDDDEEDDSTQPFTAFISSEDDGEQTEPETSE